MNDLLKKSVEELKSELADAQKTLRELRFGGAGARSNNTSQPASLKHKIAQIHTALGTLAKQSKKA